MVFVHPSETPVFCGHLVGGNYLSLSSREKFTEITEATFMTTGKGVRETQVDRCLLKKKNAVGPVEF